MDPTVAIVIVNWNGWRDTVECLESIWRVTYSNSWVVFVDNGSADDPLEKIREYCAGEMTVESWVLKGEGPSNKPVTVFEFEREHALEKDWGKLLSTWLVSNR